MTIESSGEYYFWCCDWCDSENLVLWSKLQDGASCGACHRPHNLQPAFFHHKSLAAAALKQTSDAQPAAGCPVPRR